MMDFGSIAGKIGFTDSSPTHRNHLILAGLVERSPRFGPPA